MDTGITAEDYIDTGITVEDCMDTSINVKDYIDRITHLSLRFKHILKQN